MDEKLLESIVEKAATTATVKTSEQLQNNFLSLIPYVLMSYSSNMWCGGSGH